MIKSKLNLRCDDGHKWYAPNPLAWIGKECRHKKSKCSAPLGKV